METSIVNKLIVEVYVYLVVLFVINLEKLSLNYEEISAVNMKMHVPSHASCE